MSFDYYRFDDYPIEMWGERNFSARDKFMIAWAGRYDLIATLKGTVYPYVPATNAIPHSATIRPMGVIDGNGDYEYAIVEFVYSNELRELNNYFVSEEFIGSKEAELLDYRDFLWSDDNALTPGQAPRHLISTIDIRVSFWNLALVPTAAITLLGYVNDGPATSFTTGVTFAAGTLLYDTFYLKRDVGLSGEDGFRLEYVFKARPKDWNYFFRPTNTGEWLTLKCKADDSNYIPHPYGTFSALVP